MDQNMPAQERKAAHELNAQESAILSSINSSAVNIKARLFELGQQTKAAEKELEQAQKVFDGALASLTASHGMPGATVTPDFRKLVLIGG